MHLLYSVPMQRYLDNLVLNDLAAKTVLLTGPRQVGKTTLSRQLMQSFGSAQYLNWDVLADRVVKLRREWAATDARRVGFDDADQPSDRSFRHAAAAVNAATGTVRRRHVRERAVINVEQTPLSTFKQQPLLGRQCLMQKAQ